VREFIDLSDRVISAGGASFLSPLPSPYLQWCRRGAVSGE
jgi:hypothetical protein